MISLKKRTARYSSKEPRVKMKHIFKCTECGKYTMKESCSCGGKAVNCKPAKYSPEDNYGKYRRQVKRKALEEKGIL